MYLNLCLYGVFLIASAQSGSLTLPETSLTKKSSSDGAKTDLPNKTNLTLVSEGGALLPSTPDLSLSKEKLNSLITLDAELSKTKEKAVVPRKGVDMQADDKNSSQADDKKSLQADDKKSSQAKVTGNITPKTSNTGVINESTDILVKPELTNTQTESKQNKTEVPKKPMITSYEALTNMEKQIQNNHLKIPAAPSTKTMASSQIPSPNEEPIKKVYPSKGNNSHPGMIMPIVITILVVPMFAIVGYFALKRGQEAWKNRHYKRMDFLLDGMYND